ncbi:hypothetical protein [Streptomyces sp. NPDC051286]|uniref:hypothetical protein n=1 Tax=Streptomyces sp. NPDC051286 TaxID=3365647 RepID=UPI00379CC79D
MELYAPVDDDGGRGGGAADSQAQAGEVVEDHPAGRPDCLVARIQAPHLLFGSQGAADLAFDQAEQQQGQADHGDQCGEALVVLTKIGVTARGPLKSL